MAEQAVDHCVPGVIPLDMASGLLAEGYAALAEQFAHGVGHGQRIVGGAQDATFIGDDFLKGARLDDLLEVETRIVMIARASLEMRQTIRRGKETLVELTVKIAAVGRDMKPARLPDAIRQRLMPQQ